MIEKRKPILSMEEELKKIKLLLDDANKQMKKALEFKPYEKRKRN